MCEGDERAAILVPHTHNNLHAARLVRFCLRQTEKSCPTRPGPGQEIVCVALAAETPRTSHTVTADWVAERWKPPIDLGQESGIFIAWLSIPVLCRVWIDRSAFMWT